VKIIGQQQTTFLTGAPKNQLLGGKVSPNTIRELGVINHSNLFLFKKGEFEKVIKKKATELMSIMTS